MSIVRPLHRISCLFFYTFGLAVILGLILLKNGVEPALLTALLHSFDLPLIGSGMAYAGTGLYMSLRHTDDASPVLAGAIAMPLIILFIVFVIINFAMPLA